MIKLGQRVLKGVSCVHNDKIGQMVLKGVNWVHKTNIHGFHDLKFTQKLQNLWIFI